MDTPGITSRPIETMHGEPEFCEVFFDDVLVPFDRTLGEEGDGWAFAMDLLPYERSTSLWQRAAFLHRRLQRSARRGRAGPDRSRASWARSRSSSTRSAPVRAPRSTAWRAARPLGAETSIDKVLLATAEQAVFDLVGRRAAGRGHHRRRRRERTLAHGVPLLARRQHLRRQRGDPAQHHRPPPPRPRERPMIEGDDLELFERSLARRDRAAHRRRARRRARRARLARRARRSTRGPRCRGCSSCQGEACATSSALDHVVAFAHRPRARRRDVGRAPGDRAVERTRAARAEPRRPCAAWPPRSAVDGSSSPTPATGTSPRWSTRRRSQARPVHGVDPWLGLVEVHGEVDVDDAERRSTGPTAVALAQLAVAHELVGRVAEGAGTGTRARTRTHPVRPADRPVPGGSPPSRRDARRDRDRDRRRSTPRGSTSRR